MSKSITLATRKSPLAIIQTKLACHYLKRKFPDCAFRMLKLSTTGDKRSNWSLETEGGKGHLWMLFLSVGLLSTVPTSLVFFGLSSDAQAIFQGLILVIAVTIDGYRAKKVTL